MIGHEAIGMNLPTGLDAGLTQRSQEALAVSVILENGFAAVAAIHDVIDRARILDSQLPSHAP